MAGEGNETAQDVVTGSADVPVKAEVGAVEPMSISIAQWRSVAVLMIGLAVSCGGPRTQSVDATGGDSADGAIASAESGESEDLEVMVDTNQVIVMNISDKVVTVFVQHLNDAEEAIKSTTNTLKPGNNARMAISGSPGDIVRVTDGDGKTSQYPVMVTKAIPEPPRNPGIPGF